jgi:sugar lactone lactonase YvrE
LLPAPASAASTVTQVASGLDSPRGIGFYNGQMVVAEAGHGGDACFTPTGSPFPICIGNTSQLSWVNTKAKTHTPLVTGLFSVSLGPEGVLGASGLSTRDGKILTVIGATPQEAPPTSTIAQAQAGRLLSVNPKNGSWKSVASVGAKDFEFTTQFKLPTPHVYSPNTNEHDANPYGVLATDNGTYVADAGANTLDLVSRSGKISIFHYFEWRDPNPDNFPNDAVPTCVAQTAEALWVGDLSGHLFKVVGKSVTQVVPKDSAGNPVLTHVTGCTTDQNGNLYLVNMFGPGIPFTSPSFFAGNVVKYPTDEDGGSASVVAANLVFPNMAAIGPDGNLYVTTGSICPGDGSRPLSVPPDAPNPCGGGGKVLKISLPHGEGDNHTD